ncbi:hypothetical protein TCAL_09446 [Tigriopus californicus]|uniref:Uncharacterized protein n=1 Tax=Tigriopus californicus TaxID=6832 RepID=A0A553PTR6_TIGCA|nr:uncharacterized protein LOC131891578 [Tigriopus californicus]TRY81054.1 hypothetical protein TCAL_09446 [Tigriopus californicus]|eukprot:TCALIF_09446-PA protein Name:"Protein of unknown function" AED:0.00 eAED:0.00 QI:139/1/1/1/0.5/0.66/3/138/153
MQTLTVFSGLLALTSLSMSLPTDTEAPPMNLVCQVCTWGDDVENLDGGSVQPNRCQSLQDIGEAQECPNEDDICFTHIAAIYSGSYEAFRGCVSKAEASAEPGKCALDDTDENIEINVCYCDEELCNNPAPSSMSQALSLLTVSAIALLAKFA